MKSIEIRQARPRDAAAILELQHVCYPLLSTVAAWRREHLDRHQHNFPQGQFVAVDGPRIVGHCATFITRSEVALRPHTFREITHRGTFDGHDPNGDTLYGAEIMVHPEYRRQGTAKRFYETRFELVRSLGLHYFVAGGRLPGFDDHRAQLSIEAYVEAVLAGTLKDRVLSPQLRSGLRYRGLLPDYLNDPRSRNYASLLVWENPDWQRSRSGAPRGMRRRVNGKLSSQLRAGARPRGSRPR